MLLIICSLLVLKNAHKMIDFSRIDILIVHFKRNNTLIGYPIRKPLFFLNSSMPYTKLKQETFITLIILGIQPVLPVLQNIEKKHFFDENKNIFSTFNILF